MRYGMHACTCCFLAGAAQLPTPARDPLPAPSTAVIVHASMVAARRVGKPLMLLFVADYCGKCQLLEQALDDPAVDRAMRESYVLARLHVVSADQMRRDAVAASLMAHYGGPSPGYPFYVWVSPYGKKLAQSYSFATRKNLGVPVTAARIAEFDRLLRQTAPHMRAADHAVILQRLRGISRS